MTLRRLITLLPASLVVLAIAGAVHAGGTPAKARAARRAPQPGRAAATAPRPAPLRPAYGGLIVGVDPETGVLGPATAQQRLELLGPEAEMLSRSTDGLAQVPLPGGGVLLDLGGRFQELTFVRLGADGRWVFGCTSDAASLRRTLTAPATPAPALEVR